MQLRHTHTGHCSTLYASQAHTHTGHCRTLYAPQAHTLVTAAHCTHLRHTNWSLRDIVCTSRHTLWSLQHLVCTSHTHTHTHTHQSMQHTVQPAITLNSAFTCPVLLSQQTVITTPKQQLRHILVNETQCFQ